MDKRFPENFECALHLSTVNLKRRINDAVVLTFNGLFLIQRHFIQTNFDDRKGWGGSIRQKKKISWKKEKRMTNGWYSFLWRWIIKDGVKSRLDRRPENIRAIRIAFGGMRSDRLRWFRNSWRDLRVSFQHDAETAFPMLTYSLHRKDGRLFAMIYTLLHLRYTGKSRAAAISWRTRFVR